MLTSALTMNKINSLDITTLKIESLYADRLKFMNTMVSGAKAGFETVGRGLTAIDDSEIVPKLAFGLGAAAALAISGSLVVAGTSPIALGLGATTAAGIVASKMHSRLPIDSIWSSVTRQMASKVLPFATIGLTGYITDFVHEANLRITGIFEEIGLKGTILFGLGLLYMINNSVRKNIREFRESYGGQLDPGTFKGMKSLVSASAYSMSADAHYVITRLILLGAASAYLFTKIGLAMSVPFALPPLALASMLWIRKHVSSELPNKKLPFNLPEKTPAFIKKRFPNNELQTSKLIDNHLKTYLPFHGLALGALSTMVFGGSAIFPLAYLVFWGSLGTFVLAEAFGAGHSMNTNASALYSYKTSHRDLIGEHEAKQLSGHQKILAINPHTGTREHTIGVLFSIFCASKPGLAIVCMYDLILQQKANLTNFNVEKQFLEWLNNLRNNFFTRLYQSMDVSASIQEQFESFIANLEAAADYYEGELKKIIIAKKKQTDEACEGLSPREKNSLLWFIEDIPEFWRGSLQLLSARAEKFRNRAQRLRNTLTIAETSDLTNPAWREQLYKEWTEELECFDPDLVEIISVARKELFGDELKIRKVENVASIGMYRGLYIYKLWKPEPQTVPKEVNTGYPPTEWVMGRWTAVKNPNFRYYAQPGTLEAAKHIWIKADNVLVDLQKKHRDNLSTSHLAQEMDNTPSSGEGFETGTIPINLEINHKQLQVTEYYFNPTDHKAIPTVKNVLLRNDTAETREALTHYKIATINEIDPAELAPVVFHIPLYDATLMMDKNDVQVNTYMVEPAILERERQDIVAALVYRYPFGNDISFPNPYPKKELDQRKGINIVGANIELTYEGKTIPFQIERAAATAGLAAGINWKSLKGAIRKADNSFVLVFGEKSKEKGSFEVTMPPSRYPKYLNTLGLPEGKDVVLGTNNFVSSPQREGDMSWFMVPYTDGSIAFVRVPDGERPIIFNKDRQRMWGKE